VSKSIVVSSDTNEIVLLLTVTWKNTPETDAFLNNLSPIVVPLPRRPSVRKPVTLEFRLVQEDDVQEEIMDGLLSMQREYGPEDDYEDSEPKDEFEEERELEMRRADFIREAEEYHANRMDERLAKKEELSAGEFRQWESCCGEPRTNLEWAYEEYLRYRKLPF
jgi:hypothetical protein